MDKRMFIVGLILCIIGLVSIIGAYALMDKHKIHPLIIAIPAFIVLCVGVFMDVTAWFEL